ncbi:MAG: hypothetical protein KGJ59_11640 [Bacteroidota bacterium]|nr:hypothetical protein [Bacteroidota bacterium]
MPRISKIMKRAGCRTAAFLSGMFLDRFKKNGFPLTPGITAVGKKAEQFMRDEVFLLVFSELREKHVAT